MQTIGQHHPAVDQERMRPAYPSDGFPQKPDVPCEQIVVTPLQCVDRDEVSPAGMPGALVIGHGVMLAVAFMRRYAG